MRPATIQQHEIKLSQISVIIATGWVKTKCSLVQLPFSVSILCHSIKWIPNVWELITIIQYGEVSMYILFTNLDNENQKTIVTKLF